MFLYYVFGFSVNNKYELINSLLQLPIVLKILTGQVYAVVSSFKWCLVVILA
jgi:hypothetical protein